ncbi:ribosomal protein S6--L-glutamate ligase [Fictibacillus solisalsi]|uniref:Ribosomal protein S6--L-glutamate ligase n=1 Tax=Fictibacillus solisalsi TaxID=459525 RepID=A0A1G9URH4_9BACL|nr:hypothetical protein [Fictibacillus solisalsi]SDM62476.1 ribosomal protein S6--L-glutamate ligase [Fictibacillus solisalsi]
MKLVTFNPFRTIGIPNVQYVKPDHMFKELEKIKQADVLLFPENWQVNSLVYGMKKRIFPSIESIQLGYSKMEMTRALWTVCPENVPYTEILGNSKDSRQNILETFPFPFVAKEIRNSMGRGVFLVNNEEDFYNYSEANDILYVQEYLPIDRDLRVCVVGDEIIGSYWRIGSNGFHNNVSQGGSISFDQIPEEALELVRQTAKALNVNHAGFDIVAAGDKYYILEFNVLFGNQAFNHLEVSPEKKIYEYLLKAEASQ